MISRTALACIALISILLTRAYAGALVRSAAGGTPADIQAAVDQFRIDVSTGGGLNAPGTGPFSVGRREINWEGVPDAFSDPNSFPEDFFNNNVKQGAVLFALGPGGACCSLLVSADSANPTSTPVRFSSLNPGYLGTFQTFSPERLFTGLGSTIVDVIFYVPSSPTTHADVNGFGAVFTDVEIAGSTTIEYIDGLHFSLGVFAVPPATNGGLSFLGVSFTAGERVAAVRITSGNTALGPANNDGPNADVVVMDDFIYGEPVAFDNCPNSDLRPKVDVNLTEPGETSIDNVVDENGCSIQDLVNDCADFDYQVSSQTQATSAKRHHGPYVRCIVQLANDLRKAGTITRRQKKELKVGAAHSNIP